MASSTTLGDTLGDVNANALINAVGDTLGLTHKKARSPEDHTARYAGIEVNRQAG